MRILIVSQYFHPENFRINDFAEEFKNRGHKITVLTSIPNYPKGSFFNGYGYLKNAREVYNGIEIFRSPVIPRGSGSPFRLAINYISFIFGGIFRSLFLLNRKFDLIFVFEPSPITVVIPAIFIKKIKKLPILFWVLDLWPESVVSAGNLKTNFIPKLLDPIVKFIYKNSDKILVSSKGFVDSIEKKGINKSKIEFYPQWAESIFKPVNNKNRILKSIPEGSFIIMFAGNIGEAQDFPSIVKAAKILKNKTNIHWVILGGGRKKNWLVDKIKKHQLENNFHILGSFPLDDMPKYYSEADCMLFSLKREYIFSITIPAKVQSYLACAKPIIAMIDGEAAKIVNDAEAGFICPSESPELLAKKILKLSELDKRDIARMGLNALEHYNKNFERGMMLDRFENLFLKVIKS